MLTILQILLTLLDLYSWALIIYALLTWLPKAFENPFGRFIHNIVSPYLDLFSVFRIGNIGFSVIIALLVLGLVRDGLIFLFQFFI